MNNQSPRYNNQTMANNQIQITKQRLFGKLVIVNWLLFGVWYLVFGVFAQVYAFNLDNVKVLFLEGDYKSAIAEGEKLIAKSANSDELYYILGLSYLKYGNLLRASDIFEIILEEFKDSKFSEEARLGLGDVYFLKGDFAKARDYYAKIISSNPNTKLKPQTYYRLSQVGFKTGDSQQGRHYLEMLKREFPLAPELILDKDICLIPGINSDFYYSVQVGAFSKIDNARNLAQRLTQKGFLAFYEEGPSSSKQTYRVKVGKFPTRQEAEEMEKKLSSEGYPTKIYP